ncbi:hypothetical protein [Metabacillus sediminilitoris]|uniref:hypothetical protein n=1 Tax=Metabacillus sediminilitoris TaxID=2567941 RepID=UPI001454DE56|nr:hypothetical protein [Metabacillus sediminilitoris]
MIQQLGIRGIGDFYVGGGDLPMNPVVGLDVAKGESQVQGNGEQDNQKRFE